MGVPTANLGGGEVSPVIAAMMQRYAQFAPPQQLPKLQHSALLAEALQGIQKSGSQNLRTKGALATNLLSDAILAFASNRANKDLATQDATNWKDYAQTGASVLPGDQPPPDQQSPPSGATPPTTPPAASPETAAATATDTPGSSSIQAEHPIVQALLSRSQRNNNPLNLTTLPGGERWNGQIGADGRFAVFDNPQDGLAAADKNLSAYGSRHGIHTLAGVVGRWAPPGENDTAGYIGRVSNETGFAPNANINLGDPAIRQSLLGSMAKVEGPGSPAPASGTADSVPRPVQVSTGPDHAMPSPDTRRQDSLSSGHGAPPGSPAGAPVRSSPGQSAPSSGAIPPVPIQAWQREHLQQLGQAAEQHPQFRQAYMDYLGSLQKQASTPEEVEISRPNDAGQVTITGKVTQRQWLRTPEGVIVNAAPKMQGDGRGGFSPLPGTGYEQIAGGPPGAILQRNQMTGQVSAEAVPNAQQQGQAWDSRQQRYVPVPGLQYQDVPGPPNALTQRAPNGQLDVKSNPAFGPVPAGMAYQAGGGGANGVQATAVGNALPLQQKLEMTKSFVGSKEYQDYQESSVALNSLKALATQKTGPATFAAFDQYLRASNPGVSARPSALELAEQMFGKQSAAYAQINSWINTKGAVLPPQILQAMINGAQSMTGARYQALKPQIDAYTYTAKQNGIDPAQIMPNVTPPDGYGAPHDGPAMGPRGAGWSQQLPPPQLHAARSFAGATGAHGSQGNPLVPRNSHEFEAIHNGLWYIDTDGAVVQKGGH